MLAWQAPLVTVGCAPIVGTPTADSPSGSIFKAGMTTVNYSIKDTKGNEGKCSFTINVKETTPPKFDDAAFPKDISLAANENDCSATPTWTLPTATDLCSSAADVTVTKIAGPNIGDKLNIANYTVTYRAVDKAGITAEKSFTITVKDQTAPKILCPKNSAMKVNLAGAKIQDLDNQIISASPSTDCKEIVVNFKPLIVTENCSPFTVTPGYTAKFPLGAVTPYTFVATDKEGNKSTCEVTVEVVELDAPKISLSTVNPLCEKEAIQLLADSIPNTQYAWSGPKGFTSSEVKPFVKNLSEVNNGDYSLKITQNGCISPSSTIVSLSVLVAPKDPKEDKFIAYTGDELSETVITNDNLIAGKKTLIAIKETTKNGTLKMRNDGAFTYTSNKGYVGMDNFLYTVSYEECPDATSIPVLARIEVRVKEAKVPNVLTPNNDGVNDLLIIDYPFNGKEKSELYIYNEWGHEVYRAVPYDNTKAWKSTYKDNPVPDGTYYYLFIPDEGQPGQKGFITVLR
jgi:gliding motility-associated-like protein